MTSLARLCLIVIALAACSRRSTPAPVASSTASAVLPSPSSAALATSARGVVRHGIEWYEDAAEAALERARREHKPLLVDLWAPWCHTCLSMQEYVLTDAKLPGLRERFVFLSLDTDRPQNAGFLARFAVSVWPTFYVLDPNGPEVRGRWLGAATPAEFARFAEEGAAAVELGHTFPASDFRAALLAGDRLAAERRFEPAAEKYAEALARAPADWPRRPALLVALIAQYSKARKFESCAELALSSSDQSGDSVSAADFASFALHCASQLPKGDARSARVRNSAERRLSRLCEGEAPALTADDRGDACGNLEAVRRELGDLAGARRAAERGLSLLSAAAEGVPDAVAHTYDRARADFLVSLGRADEALLLLSKREMALPDNYNAPHLKARVYRSQKRWSEGLVAIDRALALAYGPRRVNLMSLKVDLLLGARRKAEARAVLAAQLAAYEALPEGQKLPEAEASARKRLAETN